MANKKFDIYKFYKDRGGFSWSAMSSFEYDPEQWYQSYIKGIRQESKELAFGSMVDKRLQEDPKFLPQVERYPIMQHKMLAPFGKVNLIGFGDGFDPKKLRLKDDKTGKKAWDKKRADETGQLTMYAMLLWLTKKIRPEAVDFAISWLPTVEGGDFGISFRDNPVVPFIFHTKRTMREVLEFGQRINKTLKAMQEYVRNHD